MELSPKQQINELVKKSQNILILSHSNLGGDSLGGMLALERTLSKQGKDVTIVSSSLIDETLTFLPGIEKVKKDIEGTRDLIIQIDSSKFPIEKLSYNQEEDFLNIIISPKNGQIDSNKLKVVQGSFKFDLIFILDSQDVDKIDAVYDRHTELFFETPIINIDHHAGNEYYGTVNFVDLTATSTCEILVSLIESMGANNFDEDVATCLLAGIIADTGSFKNTNTTPKSLTISAQMLAAGARQQEIIQNLYRTRPLNTLKLWGKVLSRLEFDREHRFVYSYVTFEDFKETGAHIDDIRNVMDELLTSTPGTDVVLLLAEHEPTKVAGKLKGVNGQDVLAIAEIFGGSGKAQSAGFDLVNKTLDEAIPEVISKLQNFRAVQLGRKKPELTPKNEIEIPKQTQEVPKTVPHNHLPESKTEEIKNETNKLDEKIEENSKVQPKAEVQELFNKFVSAEVPVDNTTPIEEVKEIPAIDPIMQALESLEHEEKFGAENIEESISIEQIIDSNQVEETPSIDIADLQTKEESLKALKEIMRGYEPGKNLGQPPENENNSN